MLHEEGCDIMTELDLGKNKEIWGYGLEQWETQESRRLLEASEGATYIHTYLAFGNGEGY